MMAITLRRSLGVATLGCVLLAAGCGSTPSTTSPISPTAPLPPPAPAGPAEPATALDAGEYTLTFAIDLATALSRFPLIGEPPIAGRSIEAPCEGFPVDLASRTYAATITQPARGERTVRVNGPTVRPFSGFGMSVAGDEAAFEIEWSVAEDFDGFRYLHIGGGARAARMAVDSSVSMPFHGEFWYCELTSPQGIYNDCSQVPRDRIVHNHACASERVTMTFTRR